MGLAGTTEIVGQQPKEQAEGGSLIQGHAVTLPTGCSWIEEHLQYPPHHWATSLSNGLAWSGAAECQGRWYIGWILARHEMCMGSDVGDWRTQTCFGLCWDAGHVYLVRECNGGFMVVHFGGIYGLDMGRLGELVACRDFLHKPGFRLHQIGLKMVWFTGKNLDWV